MTTTIITALIGLFCTLASSIVTFLLTRKKYNEEVVSQKISNLNKSFDLSQRIYESTTKVLNDKIAMQDNVIRQLQDENSKLKKQVSELQIEVAKMITSLCTDKNCQTRQSYFPLGTSNDKNK